MNKELTLEEAENIVDNMYQNRWKECGVEDGNTIHMGNLSNLKYNELESASILLLRTEIRLKKENKQLKDNWIKLKECLKDVMNSCDADDKDFTETILDIMQELEQGSDSNE